MGKRERGRQASQHPPEAPGAFHNPFASLRGIPAEETPAGPPEPEAPAATPPPPARAVLRVERKGRGGRTVTIVSHLGLADDTLDAWCRDLRLQLGCGATREGNLLVFQGDQRDRLQHALTARGVRRITAG